MDTVDRPRSFQLPRYGTCTLLVEGHTATSDTRSNPLRPEAFIAANETPHLERREKTHHGLSRGYTVELRNRMERQRYSFSGR